MSDAQLTLVAAILGVIAACMPFVPAVRRQFIKRAEASPEPFDGHVSEIVGGRRPLRCGIVQHMPLVGFDMDAQRQVTPTGYYADLMNHVARSAGIQIEWIAVPWSTLTEAFSGLGCDVVLSVFEDTRRAKFGDFILPFFRIGLSGVVRADDERRWSSERLTAANTKVVVSRGEAAWHYVHDDLGLPQNRVLSVDSDDLSVGVELIKSRRADIFLVDTVTATHIARADPGAKVVMRDRPLLFYKNSVFVAPGHRELAGMLRTWLTDARGAPSVAASEKAMLQAFKGVICRI